MGILHITEVLIVIFGQCMMVIHIFKFYDPHAFKRSGQWINTLSSSMSQKNKNPFDYTMLAVKSGLKSLVNNIKSKKISKFIKSKNKKKKF